MKLQRFFILILAFCLTGCAFGGIIQEATEPPVQSSLPTAQTEPSATIETAPTEVPTVPPETHPPETAPLPVIVQPEPDDEDFVKVKTYLPDIVVDLRYATWNNFTNQKIYDFTDAWLRYGTVKKLISVQEELQQSGLYLKIWVLIIVCSSSFVGALHMQ